MKNKLRNKITSGNINHSSRQKLRVYDILDEGLYCTLAYEHKGKLFQLPTGYCRRHGRIMVHESDNSHFLDDLLKEDKVCVSVVIFDGLVLAPTAFNHSLNYRSVEISALPEEITDQEEKVRFYEAFTEKYVPGRMDELQRPSDEELALTTIVSFDLSEAHLRIENGSVKNNSEKSAVWTGVVPASVAYGIPVSDKGLKNKVRIPKYVTKMVVNSNT